MKDWYLVKESWPQKPCVVEAGSFLLLKFWALLGQLGEPHFGFELHLLLPDSAVCNALSFLALFYLARLEELWGSL